jgi:aminoglycoside phosphotransferase (APT) family kinase protein
MAQVVSDAARTRLIASGVLAALPGCEGGAQPLAIATLAGGTANETYRVSTRAGSFVVRFNDPGGAVLGVDRRREVLLHQSAARAGLAPRLLAVDPNGRFLVTEYLAGATWQAKDMGDPRRLTRLAHRLRLLHSVPAPDVPAFDPAALLSRHLERIASVDAAAAADLEPLRLRAEGVLAEARLAGRRASIVHGDLHHSNLLEAGGLYLLDFEYSAVTDPLFDLACLTAYYPQAGAFGDLLLAESGLGPQTTRDMLLEAGWLYTFLSYLWYRTFRLRGRASPHDAAQERALLARLT